MKRLLRPLFGLIQGLLVFGIMSFSSLGDAGKIAAILLFAFPFFGLQLKVPQRNTWAWAIVGLSLMAMLYAYLDYHLFIDFSTKANAFLFSVFAGQCGLSAFILFCFYCAFIEERKIIFPYERLFNEAWQVILNIVLGQCFVVLTWGLFYLAAFLFGLLGIDFIKQLIQSQPFFYIVPPLLFGIALTILCEYQPLLIKCRTIILAFCKGLYPLFVIINLGFLIATPFSHKALSTFWQITLLLSSINIVLFNGIYQAGLSKAPYKPWFRLFIYASILLLLAYTIYDMQFPLSTLRTQGFEPSAFLSFVLLLFLFAYHAGYSIAIFFSKTPPWLSMVKQTNTVLALTVAFVYIGLATPWVTQWLP